MSLVKSISGIRGTIGGRVGEGLNPVDIVRFTAAYATQRRAALPDNKVIVVGRDARLSGHMVESIVCGTLMGMGYDVVNIGLATTPTTELAVTGEKAAGGIILTASHNPKQWNALKLLNEHGEFLNDAEGKGVLSIAEKEDFVFAEVDQLGHMTHKDYLPYHVQQVLNLKLQELQNVNPVFYKEIGKYESCIKLFESERVRRQAHALEFIEKCVAEGLFLPDINYKLITQMTDIIGTALNENCLYEKYPLEDIIHSIHLSLIRGISTAKGLEVINAIYHK